MRILRYSFLTLVCLWGALHWLGQDDGQEVKLGRDEPLLRRADLLAAVMPAPAPQVSETLATALASDASPETATQVSLVVIEEPAAEPEATMVSLNDIADPTPEVAPEPQPEPQLALLYVTGSRVNVRSGPSTGFDIVGSVIRGQAVEDLGDAGDGWRAIRIAEAGVDGYMAGRFLSPDAQ